MTRRITPEAFRTPSTTTPASLPHLLLLEDEPETNQILKDYLEGIGYTVESVDNGVDGLRMVMKTPYALVICDLMMPKLSGDMFYLAVQRVRPEMCRRFVFITGHSADEPFATFLRHTRAVVLTKPFRLADLEQTLSGVLAKRTSKAKAPAGPLRIIPNQPVETRKVTRKVTRPIPKTDTGKPLELEATPPLPATTQAPDLEPASSVEPSKPTRKSPGDGLPALVVKALRLVGFMRRDSDVIPPPLKQSPSPTPVTQAKITRRIPGDIPRVTRRVPPPPPPLPPAPVPGPQTEHEPTPEHLPAVPLEFSTPPKARSRQPKPKAQSNSLPGKVVRTKKASPKSGPKKTIPLVKKSPVPLRKRKAVVEIPLAHVPGQNPMETSPDPDTIPAP